MRSYARVLRLSLTAGLGLVTLGIALRSDGFMPYVTGHFASERSSEYRFIYISFINIAIIALGNVFYEVGCLITPGLRQRGGKWWK